MELFLIWNIYIETGQQTLRNLRMRFSYNTRRDPVLLPEKIEISGKKSPTIQIVKYHKISISIVNQSEASMSRTWVQGLVNYLREGLIVPLLRVP